MAQGQVSTKDLNISQLKFTINALAMILDKLIQDDMDLDEAGEPLPAEWQSDSDIKQAMMALNYK